jgi:hypothetical protein
MAQNKSGIDLQKRSLYKANAEKVYRHKALINIAMSLELITMPCKDYQ